MSQGAVVRVAMSAEVATAYAKHDAQFVINARGHIDSEQLMSQT